YHTITANSIFEHEGGGIRLRNGGNENLAAPEITGSNPVTGTAPSNSHVEIFSDSTDQGRIYEGFTTADASGNFSFSETVTGPRVTATATDGDGNTSPFSSPALIGDLIVTHTEDEGDHSLRWAMTLANELLGPDTINFDIPEGDANFDGTAWWITPFTALPSISDSGTVIQGFSQTDLHGETNPAGPEIVISGQGRDITNGISIDAGGCEVNGLVIGGFALYGIAIRGEDDNIIRGNYIGTDPAGLDTLPNYSGIYCQGKRNRIGGMNEADKNLISGNEWQGVFLEFGSENLFIGNYIGTDRTGSVALPNREGVQLGRQSLNNTIGGTTPEERNIISGNERNGIYMQYASTRDNHIIGNYIGTDTSGTHAVSNGWRGVYISREASRNTIGGPNAEQGNLISGNLQPGIYLSSVGTDSNIIQSNFIGTDVNGTSALGNDDGIYIAYGASNNQVIENLISGNNDNGVYIRSRYSESNLIADNIIGLNITGTQALPNYLGIKISQTAQRNLVHSNIISGNLYEGLSIYGDSTWHNIISANWIGLNATGQDTLSNGGTGIIVGSGADSTIIGGLSEEDGNIISGCGSSGIYITDDTTDAATISYNWIGTDVTGRKNYGNGYDGISLNGMNHQIEYNLISGNKSSGITLRAPSQGIRIRRNLIGVQADSTSPLPNVYAGIRIEAEAVMDTIGPANRIWHNGGYAIEVRDSTDRQITITENSITNNGSGGIKLMYGANEAILTPAILAQAPLAGVAPPNCRIEIFSDSADQGRLFLGYTDSNGSGAWSWAGSLVKPNITITATDANGNTSMFSSSLMVSVEENELAAIPETYYLTQNYPNPFNPTTTIEFGLPKEDRITLKVFDLLGREVLTLMDEKRKAGKHEVSFDASSLASGLYFYRIQSGQFTKIRKMVLVK
ncbi:right-handed parallel beta-helix repeat-containing protein, partial [candidate division KSB1 bacterium]|nr:right-handed parallel beta-helix repeat-containing protein [candidate division KSB1 bacterium]